ERGVRLTEPRVDRRLGIGREIAPLRVFLELRVDPARFVGTPRARDRVREERRRREILREGRRRLVFGDGLVETAKLLQGAAQHAMRGGELGIQLERA